MKYFFAGVYQELKNRRPDGTPYFNLRAGIIGILFLHYAQVATLVKKYGISLFTTSKDLFVIYLLVGSTLIYFLLNYIIPLDELRDIEVDKKDVKRSYWISFLYFFLNLVLLMILISLIRPNNYIDPPPMR